MEARNLTGNLLQNLRLEIKASTKVMILLRYILWKESTKLDVRLREERLRKRKIKSSFYSEIAKRCTGRCFTGEP